MVLSAMENADFIETLTRLCAGKREAVALILSFGNLCEVWDDAIDGEKNEADHDIHKAFEWALFELNDNIFYRAHPELRAAMKVCIANWKAANVLEKSARRDDLATAWVLRCSPYDFTVAVVLAASGIDAAAEAAVFLRGAECADTLDAYLAEHMGKAG